MSLVLDGFAIPISAAIAAIALFYAVLRDRYAHNGPRQTIIAIKSAEDLLAREPDPQRQALLRYQINGEYDRLPPALQGLTRYVYLIGLFSWIVAAVIAGAGWLCWLMGWVTADEVVELLIPAVICSAGLAVLCLIVLFGTRRQRRAAAVADASGVTSDTSGAE